MSDDICENYHGGNPESYEANEATSKFRDQQRIKATLLAIGPDGATCDELEDALALPHQTASARCSELLRDGAIWRKRDAQGRKIRRITRHGCWASVLISKEFVLAPNNVSSPEPIYDLDGQALMFPD